MKNNFLSELLGILTLVGYIFIMVCVACFWILIMYVVYHFVTKFW